MRSPYCLCVTSLSIHSVYYSSRLSSVITEWGNVGEVQIRWDGLTFLQELQSWIPVNYMPLKYLLQEWFLFFWFPLPFFWLYIKCYGRNKCHQCVPSGIIFKKPIQGECCICSTQSPVNCPFFSSNIANCPNPYRKKKITTVPIQKKSFKIHA